MLYELKQPIEVSSTYKLETTITISNNYNPYVSHINVYTFLFYL